MVWRARYFTTRFINSYFCLHSFFFTLSIPFSCSISLSRLFHGFFLLFILTFFHFFSLFLAHSPFSSYHTYSLSLHLPFFPSLFPFKHSLCFSTAHIYSTYNKYKSQSTKIFVSKNSHENFFTSSTSKTLILLTL